MAIGRLLRGETAARAVPPRMPSPLGFNTPRAIVCDGRRFEIARVGATLPCPSMFGKADATVTGVLVDVGGRCVARGLICDDGLWFSVKPDG